MNKIERIKELVKQLNYHDNKYYVKDKPEISDKEYDQLYYELVKLENETNYILSSSPTQKVKGKVLPFLKKVQHTEPMLSAEKSKDINDVKKFMGDKECVLSWKLDGLTIVLRYNQGKFQQAITRGGGLDGEDVSHTVRTFANIPLSIDYKGYLELRGEGLVTFKDFERINNELLNNGQETYASPRNLAAGSVRQLDANITKERKLIFIAFGIVKCDTEFTTKLSQFNFLDTLGFQVVNHRPVYKGTFELLINKFKEYIPNLTYLTDGLIFEYDDITYGKSLGSTGHHDRKHFALKWADDCSTTVFRGIELNTTRTGMVSLTGLFDEIQIDGANVSRASLHNYDIFESLQLGFGDKINVYRANAVIPQIEDNLTRSGTYKIDMKCPSCGGDIEIRQPKEARFLFCKNDNCLAKLLDKFVHFCSRDAMNIEGLSEATLEKFVNKGWLKTFDDIYRLEQQKNEIVCMEGFGQKSYTKLMTAIEKSKNVEFVNFIYALGINQIGKGGAKRLAKHFNNDIKTFLRAVEEQYDFTIIEDYGRITSDSILYYFDDPVNYATVLRLLEYIKIKQEEKTQPIGLKDLSGLIFVITGAVYSFKNREQFKILVESLNGKVAGGISSRTNYLVCNEDAGSSKSQKAKALGVTVITEDEFNKMIGTYTIVSNNIDKCV